MTDKHFFIRICYIFVSRSNIRIHKNILEQESCQIPELRSLQELIDCFLVPNVTLTASEFVHETCGSGEYNCGLIADVNSEDPPFRDVPMRCVTLSSQPSSGPAPSKHLTSRDHRRVQRRKCYCYVSIDRPRSAPTVKKCHSITRLLCRHARQSANWHD